jgi:glyoxylate utilization-related uncharacterized protein
MSIKGVLLAGASLCTICAGSAFAKSAPHLVAALHANAGRVTVKTAQHPHQFTNLTSTFGVSTGVTSADYKVKTPLAQTYYTFLHSGTFCNPPKEKVVLATKKTKYAKLSTSVESYSEGCGTPSQFFGDEYDLQTKKTPKKPDTFVSSLEAKKVHFDGTVYKKATLNLDVSVTISK